MFDNEILLKWLFYKKFKRKPDSNLFNFQKVFEGKIESFDGEFYKVSFPSIRYMQGEFEENQQYYAEFTGYSDGTGRRGILYFEYTDGTSSTQITISGTAVQNKNIISESGKTVKSLRVTYGSDPVCYVKNIILKKM